MVKHGKALPTAFASQKEKKEINTEGMDKIRNPDCVILDLSRKMSFVY